MMPHGVMDEGAAVVLPAEALGDAEGAARGALAFAWAAVGAEGRLDGVDPVSRRAGGRARGDARTAGVEPGEDCGQARRDLLARHAVGEFGRVIGAQDQHVETGQHGVDIVVVEHRIRQAIEIIERADGLGQFLVQAIAQILRRGVAGHEDRQFLAVAQECPVGPGAAASAAVLGNVGDARHHETGRVGQVAADLAAGQGLDGDVGLRRVGERDVDPGLALQAADERSEVGHHGCGRAAGDAHGDRLFEAGEDRQFATRFKAEGQVEEIARDVGVGAFGPGRGGGCETLERGQRGHRRGLRRAGGGVVGRGAGHAAHEQQADRQEVIAHHAAPAVQVRFHAGRRRFGRSGAAAGGTVGRGPLAPWS